MQESYEGLLELKNNQELLSNKPDENDNIEYEIDTSYGSHVEKEINDGVPNESEGNSTYAVASTDCSQQYIPDEISTDVSHEKFIPLSRASTFENDALHVRKPYLSELNKINYEELPGKPVTFRSFENVRFHSSPGIKNKKLLKLRKVSSQPIIKYPRPHSATSHESLVNAAGSDACAAAFEISSNRNNTRSKFESKSEVDSQREESFNNNHSVSLPLLLTSPVKSLSQKTSTSLPLPRSSCNVLPPITKKLLNTIGTSTTSSLPKHSTSNSLPFANEQKNLKSKPKEEGVTLKTLKDGNLLENKKTLLKSRKLDTLPPIPVKDVKIRSYLLGNLSKKSALLGSTELQRYLPSKKIKLFILTWNVNGVLAQDSLENMLLPDELEHIPDMYAIGLQEASSQREEWEVRIQETLGPSHVMLHSELFGTLHIAIFLRRDLIWFCSVPDTSSVSTRIGASFKTKGAVAISFTFFGTTFLFITSHFTAHENKVQERIMDYRKISSSLNLPRNLPAKLLHSPGDVTEHYDRVFWFGDLNFRLNLERKCALMLIEQMVKQANPNFEMLLQSDELCKNMKKGLLFNGFQEGKITFVPTYKYDIGTDVFDTSFKLRIPSYTDRILFRTKRENSVKCLFYNSAATYKESDHKPVYGIFEVEIKSGRDNVPLAAGLFNRDVFLTALERRSQRMDLLVKPRNAMCSSVCSVM